MHQIDDLIALFNQLFSQDENTILVAGDDEPLYLPSNNGQTQHQIIFAHGFFSSALHELAHWCIAGKARRQLVDYGYWYEPDGRTADKQQAFALVEAKPQALEWILSKACGHAFVISLDNLTGDSVDITPFKQALVKEIKRFQQQGLGARAEKLQQALSQFYQQVPDYQQYYVSVEDFN